jgi:hypothetical protein
MVEKRKADKIDRGDAWRPSDRWNPGAKAVPSGVEEMPERTAGRRMDGYGNRHVTPEDGLYLASRIQHMVEAGHGFSITGWDWKGPIRAQRRQDKHLDDVLRVLDQRPDTLTPAQEEALFFFYKDENYGDGPMSYCVDENGRSLPFPADWTWTASPVYVWIREHGLDPSVVTSREIPQEVEDAHARWRERAMDLEYEWHDHHRHIYGPLNMARCARFLGLSPGAFEDRLAEGEATCRKVARYLDLKDAGEPIPRELAKYGRVRPKKGRARQ